VTPTGDTNVAGHRPPLADLGAVRVHTSVQVTQKVARATDQIARLVRAGGAALGRRYCLGGSGGGQRSFSTLFSYPDSHVVMEGIRMQGRDSEPAAYLRITHAIRERIETGELRPGALLPSEIAFCSDFGMARGTVRQAGRLGTRADTRLLLIAA
jgi:hypothetical protein